MSEPDPPAKRTMSKATRNERRKLLATLLNNLSVAFLLAGLLQSALGFLREGAPLRPGDALAILVFFVVGAMLHVLAQRVLGGLGD